MCFVVCVLIGWLDTVACMATDTRLSHWLGSHLATHTCRLLGLV